ncbi:GNAT family N-acetyltransferase [Prodigiosinella aquatilis]|nr:GNAT family N-acetyltransferase [Prodigiosinella sp. LS101]WJV54853.1 GNAT family N-acetyltransferase [Prodigiosinella sp. LS101]WJV59216.1 GNAT family N-acetyltransferase [Pectobacteriaceae bacterium C111]
METTSFLIQQAERCQIDDLIRFRSCLLEKPSSTSYACRTQEERYIWREQYRQWLYDVLEYDTGIRIFVALIGQKVIGCSTGIIDRRAPARDCISGYCGWVQSVVVDPSFRRQGVAASLLKSLTEWFSERNVSKILLESTSGSETFYLAQGFTPEVETLFMREI